MAFFDGIFGDANERFLKKLQPLAEKINSLEAAYEALSDIQLREKTSAFRERLAAGESLDDVLPEAFAAVREAAKRTLKERHFDVQLLGGIVLHQGRIAEMKTGEGKTLVATLPSYLNALEGKGVHLVTVNDYLARRDTVWMGQIYHALGLTVGCITHEAAYIYDPAHINPKEVQNASDQNELDQIRDTEGAFRVVHEFLRPVTRREAYAADITYGTNNEYGFDYLRDNMVYRLEDMVQRGHHYAIVDEVDSILIDEARTPLIISAPDEESTKLYETFAKVVPRLQKDTDYNVDEKRRAATITEVGIEKVEKVLGIENLYAEGGVRLVHHLEQALRAQALFERDRDYVVKDGEVIIVDEFTGRLMPGRRYSEGLHQAIEAKEGVEVQQESRTLATITFQNYFRMYKKLAGMTGTALTNAEEFHKVYNLDVLLIPTHKSMIREDLSDSVYKTEKGKFTALVREIKARHERGQPILIGTVSIEKNERLSALLSREGISHELLNAKNHEKEGMIIAQAGRLGAVTVATNMAGRGVDIILGGNPPNVLESDEVKKLGGLHVIGTERHEARRIDNQLRGRSGRQGDPGSSQFFLSLEDDILRIFGSERIKNLMEKLGIPEDEPIEAKLVSKAIESAQGKIEGFNFDTRKHVLEYDDVMNKQREVIYKKRREFLGGEARPSGLVKSHIADIVSLHTQEEPWNLQEITESMRAIFPFTKEAEKKLSTFETPEALTQFLQEEAERAYEEREKQLGEVEAREIEKLVMLRMLDMLWMDHLDQMEHLRDSVRLRAYGQRDPLVEYKNEGHRLFQQLLGAFQSQVAQTIYKVGIMAPEPARVVQERRPEPAGVTRHPELSSRHPDPVVRERRGEGSLLFLRTFHEEDHCLSPQYSTVS
ncbi:preprotein translocase subunit SecA [Candidatus Azambacteria bacterium]|nr:preprotein translocase subunit SecA [Candidatus Azambacteria bacterium]